MKTILSCLIALCMSVTLSAQNQQSGSLDQAESQKPATAKPAQKDGDADPRVPAKQPENNETNAKTESKPASENAKPAAARITKGPIVEWVGDTTAVIAWSTNVNASTMVRYGTSAENLNEVAQTPWGGLTHRVHIQHLQPNTTYYFEVGSEHAQGSGAKLESPVHSFRTVEKGAKGEKYPAPGE